MSRLTHVWKDLFFEAYPLIFEGEQLNLHGLAIAQWY